MFSVRCIRTASKLFQRGETTVRPLDGIEFDAGGFVALEGPSGARIDLPAGVAAKNGETRFVAPR